VLGDGCTRPSGVRFPRPGTAIGRSYGEYSRAFWRARICGFQAFLRGLRLVALARLGVRLSAGAAVLTFVSTKFSNRFQASGCSSISASSGFLLFWGFAMTAKSKSRATVSRRLPSGDMRKGLKQHVARVGEVIWAWNELQQAFAFAFMDIFKEHFGMAHGAWVGLSNDGAQRDALGEALWYSDWKQSDRKKLWWALRQTGELARYRNDIVHGARAWRLTTRGAIPTFSSMGNPISRLLRYVGHETKEGDIVEGPDLRMLMGLLRGDLMQIAAYVAEVVRSAREEKPRPSPKRPQLQARKYAREREAKLSPPNKRRPKRSRRPKASRP